MIRKKWVVQIPNALQNVQPFIGSQFCIAACRNCLSLRQGFEKVLDTGFACVLSTALFQRSLAWSGAPGAACIEDGWTRSFVCLFRTKDNTGHESLMPFTHGFGNFCQIFACPLWPVSLIPHHRLSPVPDLYTTFPHQASSQTVSALSVTEM